MPASKLRNSICTLLLVLIGIPLNGCGYPEVSPKTYEISKALFSVCNQKNEERLQVVKKLIESSLENEEISESEAEMLNEIVAQANENQWETAMVEARNLMEDQIDR